MDKKIKIAEAFPPGEFLKEELEERNWTQTDLANILGRQTSVISEIVNGKRAISLDIAAELGEVFGTGLEYWMNLEQIYRAFLKTKEGNSGLAQRAKIYAKAPIGEMKKRNWIKPSDNWDEMEESVCRLLHINSLDDEPKMFPVAAKKSTSYNTKPTPAQQAWFFRARELAEAIQAVEFSLKTLEGAIRKIKQLLANPEDVRQVARVLSEGGIRFLIVENIAHSKIDGACFWLDERRPVIVMGLRYDRLDNFWHVLSHEIGHVHNRDGISSDEPVIDVNLVGDETTPFDEKSDVEQKADLFAQDMLVDQNALENWIHRTAPLYSKTKIIGFAMTNGVHPAIVLGQLQHRKEVPWSHNREMLVKVRHLITASALTDGFGSALPASA